MNYCDLTNDQLQHVLKEKQRLVAKLDTEQMAYKIALNSCYGAIGNPYFRHFDIRQAEAITLSGQLSIRWIEKELNLYLNKLCETENETYVIYSDTDSCYLKLDKLVQQLELKDKSKTVDFLDKACEEINKFIDKKYAELAKYTNAKEQAMIMKREIIADRAFWIAKKRYAMHVYDEEGTRLDTPKLKIMGLETARSSTPAFCREKLTESIRIILTKTEDDLIEFINQTRKEFKKLSPKQVCFPRGVNGLAKWSDKDTLYKKACPIHVKGSLIHNKLIKDLKLQNSYADIRDGDKIKFAYLTKPNPTKDSVIAFVDDLPKEFDLHSYIDYNKMFDKTFLEPLQNILNVIGWRSEKKSSLEDLFV